MKALTRIFWGGFYAFIACLAVGLFTAGSTTSDTSTFALFLSIPCAATMMLGMLGMSVHKDETKAQHASYCLHCAQGLAQDIKYWLEHNPSSLNDARAFGDEMWNVAETLEKVCGVQLTSQSRDELARLYPRFQPMMENALREARQTLDHLRAHQRSMEALAKTVNEMTALSKHSYFLKGTYRTGPAPAGQLLYGGQQEPQQEVVILSHPLNIMVQENKVAIDTLEAAIGLAQPSFHRFANHIASSK